MYSTLKMFKEAKEHTKDDTAAAILVLVSVLKGSVLDCDNFGHELILSLKAVLPNLENLCRADP